MNMSSQPPTVSDVENLVDEVDPVFTLEWDSGAPGPGSGCVSVYPWHDGFVVYNDSTGGAPTVYSTLRAALVEGEAGYVTPATTEIECPSLPAADVVRLLTHPGFEPVRLRVNGEVWEAPASTDSDASPAFRPSAS